MLIRDQKATLTVDDDNESNGSSSSSSASNNANTSLTDATCRSLPERCHIVPEQSSVHDEVDSTTNNSYTNPLVTGATPFSPLKSVIESKNGTAATTTAAAATTTAAATVTAVVTGTPTTKTAVTTTATSTSTERRKKKPYKELTLEEKVQLIRLAEENAGLSQASIAERYSIAKSNVCRILQRKSEYLRAYELAGFAGSRKRKLRGDPNNFNATIPATLSIHTRQATPLIIRTSSNERVIRNNHHSSNSSAGYLYRNHTDARNGRASIIRSGNETLRAHMYKQHQISRMFMCRCCNWAFPDKTSLHMHIQAKEEGKTVSVPVIGKGNPPMSQQRSENVTAEVEEATSTTQSTLHVPQPRISQHQQQQQQQQQQQPQPQPQQQSVTANPFTPLQLHSLASMTPQQPLNVIGDSASIQAAAASMFSQMTLFNGSSENVTAQTEDLMVKLRERLMLNNLVAQSSFGLAAWLAAYPKLEQSGEYSSNPAVEFCSPNDGNAISLIAQEDDEINVDKEFDEEILVDRNTVNDTDNNINLFSKKDVTIKDVDISSSDEQSKSSNESQDEKKLVESEMETVIRPPSNGTFINMPNLRSAISGGVKGFSIANNHNSRIAIAESCGQNGMSWAESSDVVDSHLSPSSEVNSSPNGNTPLSAKECLDCSVYKGKLAVAESRCRYLEGRTATLQSDALRFSTRVSVSENSARHFEQEGRILREQNELLQRKLLECQEKTLAFMQSDHATNTQAVAVYLNEILKTTFIR